jgi:hypothetical protein
MSLIASAADRMLSVIVPRASADAWSCDSGCHRVLCGGGGGCTEGHWWNACVNSKNEICNTCRETVYTC